MKKTLKQYRNKDHTKLLIIKYLFSKEAGTVTSLYEILHHADNISSYDYRYMKQLMLKMADSGWIRIIKSGHAQREKLNYSLTSTGRRLYIAVKGIEKNHPILNLDVFKGI